MSRNLDTLRRAAGGTLGTQPVTRADFDGLARKMDLIPTHEQLIRYFDEQEALARKTEWVYRMNQSTLDLVVAKIPEVGQHMKLVGYPIVVDEKYGSPTLVPR